MGEPFLGQITCFGCNFAPRNWALCNGHLLAISQNAALFAILGTTYGGDGQVTFALPNLQGQVAMHWGTTGGQPSTVIGETQGMAALTLLITQIPQHNHQLTGQRAGTGATRTAAPTNAAYLSTATASNFVYDSTAPTIASMMSPQTIGVSGNSAAHDNMQPYLTLNYCVAIEGAFPVRN